MIDAKLPKSMTELKHKAVMFDEQLIEILLELHVFFGQMKKVEAWMITKNPHFGFIAPLKLLQIGKGDKVLSFILNARHESEIG